jgi:cell wall-associated NlpC family hydrolase
VATRRYFRPAFTCLALSAVVATSLPLTSGTAAAEPRLTIGQVQRRVDDLNRKAEIATERYNDARVELADEQQKLASVQDRLKRQQATVDALRGTMGDLASARYRSGGIDATVQLLLSDSPDVFLDRASSLDQISKRQSDSLRKITVAQQDLSLARLAVAQELGRLAELKKQAQDQKRTIEANLAEAEELLNSLKAEERARLVKAAREARARALAQARASRSEARNSDNGGGSGGGGGGGGDDTPSYNGPASGRAAVAVRTAYAQLGDPYVWGAGGPGSFDCSGLTAYAWRAAGVSLPHSSRAQAGSGRHVSRSQLRPGDLVFFYSPISHVGIYIGGGRMIHAPHPGASVEISSISTMPYSGAVRP